MRIQKLKLSFAGYGDAAFLIKAKGIALDVSTVEAFKESTPTMAEILAAISDFDDALALAADGSKKAIADKNKKRETLEDLLRQLALFVMMVAKGDRALLAASGFDLVAEPVQRPLVGPSSLLVNKGNNRGEVAVTLTGAKNVRSYVHEYTPDPVTDNSVWVQETDTKAQHMFEGLPSVKAYWFRSAAIGLDGVKIYSEPVMWVVQ